MQTAVPQNQTAAMGPMGLRHVWPFVLAPSGRSWQTHAWGCCQHVWALCHALGCTLRACFGVPTLFGRHLGIPLSQLGFWQFFAVFGQPARQFSCSVAPKGTWVALKIWCICHCPTQTGHSTPNKARCQWHGCQNRISCHPAINCGSHKKCGDPCPNLCDPTGQKA